MKLVHVAVVFAELLAAAMSLVADADAAPLKAVINLPTTATAGDDIEISTAKSTGEILRRHFKCERLDAVADAAQRVMIDDSKDDASPRLRSYAGQYRITLQLVDKEGYIDETAATITIASEGCPPTPCPVCPKCPDVTPTPIVPIPVVPIPVIPTPVVPVPNPDPGPPAPFAPINVPAGEYGVSAPTAAAIRAVLMAKFAEVPATDPQRNAKLQQAYHQWLAESEDMASKADVVAAQLAAGTITNIKQIKLGNPGTTGWKAADDAVAAIILAAWTKYKSDPAKSLAFSMTTGAITVTANYGTLVREISVGIRGAK